MEWFGRNLVGSIRGSVSPQSGDHEQCRARTGLRPFRVSSRLGQATDLAVTQAVVDEDEKFAGGRHPSDLLSTALAHPLVVSVNRCGAPLAGHRLDGGPAHESGSLLGDVSTTDLLVGLVVGGGEPGPAAQVPGGGEPPDVADLGHEDRSQHRTDAGDGLDGVEAEVPPTPLI